MRLPYPVVSVTWRKAIAFCEWLQANLEGLKDLQGFAVCLPTEAQWEKAARGVDGRKYPWGSEFDKTKCNTYESGIGDTTPVGKYSPRGDSPYGIADMSGNVWEWCQSKYKPYPPYRADDGREVIDASGDSRVVRGGAWLGNEVFARCACRNDHTRGPLWYLGFRVVAAFAGLSRS